MIGLISNIVLIVGSGLLVAAGILKFVNRKKNSQS